MKYNNNVLKQGYFGWRAIGHNIKMFFRNLKYAWQRVVRGYCDRDVWDLDHYLSAVIAGTLLHLANHNHGYPYGFADSESWENMLREVADKFDFQLEDSADNIFTDQWLEDTNNDELKKCWEFESQRLHNKQREALKEGMDFLYEYYDSLWD